MDAPRRSRTFHAVLIVTLIASVGLLVRTAQREQSVRQSWKDLYDLAMNPHSGMYVPVYGGLSTAGDTVAIGDVPSGHRQLLYFFTTSCPYCRASVPMWKTLGKSAGSRDDVDVYGVAVDSSHALTDYEREHDLTYPVIRMANARFARLFRVSGVPLTMIVDPGGQVAYARRGEFSSRALIDSVRAVLDQPLPDPIELTPQVPSVGTPADANTVGAS